MLVKATATIYRDPKAVPPVVNVGDIVDLEGAELKRVKELNAVTTPTKAELALSANLGKTKTGSKKKATKVETEHSEDDQTDQSPGDGDGEVQSEDDIVIE